MLGVVFVPDEKHNHADLHSEKLKYVNTVICIILTNLYTTVGVGWNSTNYIYTYTVWTTSYVNTVFLLRVLIILSDLINVIS
jgi:hypothetical protein